MKKTIIAAAVMAAMTPVAMAQTAPASNSGAYVNLEGGLNLPKGNAGSLLSKGFDFGLAAGYHMGMFQGELEYMFIRNSLNNDAKNEISNKISAATHVPVKAKDLSIHRMQNAFMANFGISYPMSQLKLTGMVGLGMVHSSVSESVDGLSIPGDFLPSSNAFAMQGIVGAQYMLNSNVGMGVNYHLLTWKKDGARIYNNMINASVSYSFAA